MRKRLDGLPHGILRNRDDRRGQGVKAEQAKLLHEFNDFSAPHVVGGNQGQDVPNHLVRDANIILDKLKELLVSPPPFKYLLNGDGETLLVQLRRVGRVNPAPNIHDMTGTGREPDESLPKEDRCNNGDVV